jgi:alcohol dehydrogenase class IV
VVFGAGSFDRLPDEVARLDAARVVLVSTPGHRHLAEDAAARLGDKAAGIWDRAKMHVPIENAEAARAEARRLAADACVAVGGGTPIGLAKAIALELELPIVAVPTTYSGSEMTPVLGITEGGVKRTRKDLRMLPKTVIYDPELTFGLPPAVSGPSGMNAIAHCVEALYASDGNPITSLIAEDGIRALAGSLPVVVREPEHPEARAEALYGAFLAGTALAAVGMALHHKLCHVLGGSFDLPHAEVHTIILPHATVYNRAGAPASVARIARALDAEDAAAGLFDLAASLGTKLRLADLGMRESDLDRAADLAVETPYPNPSPINRTGIRALLDDAFHGRRPAIRAP